MSVLIYSLLSAFIVSLLALLGIVTLALQEKLLKKILIFLVSFSAGGLIGSAFFHLLPETLAVNDNTLLVFVYLMIGFLAFFLIEKILRWHHCHDEKCDSPMHIGYLNLFGDGMHNFIDGMIIVSAFTIDINLGLIVTLSIIFHELPQEIGDFGVLIYSGIKKSKAIFYNFIVALTSILGVLAGYFLINNLAGVNNFLIPAAAGGFIYIAASDLIPELHKETLTSKSILTFVTFVLALGLMLIFKIFI